LCGVADAHRQASRGRTGPRPAHATGSSRALVAQRPALRHGTGSTLLVCALPYQRWLGATLSFVLPLLGIPIRVTGLGVSTPFEIGLFVALCLTSRGAPWLRRVGALLHGLALIVVAELVLFAVSFALEFWMGGGSGRSGDGRGVATSIRELIVWALAPGVWFLLLGSRNSPDDHERRPRTGAGRPGPALDAYPEAPGLDPFRVGYVIAIKSRIDLSRMCPER